MKISLISPYTDITSFGIRTLSAHLKRHGNSVQLIFMPDQFGDDLIFGVKRYPDSVMDEMTSLCSESDLIGISAMTNFFDGVVQITQTIKRKLNIPVIWGGVHPTIRPEESLIHADMVCIGEAEDALLELVSKMSNGENYLDTNNFWIKKGDKIFRNDLCPLPGDLDVYPFPDYSMDDHHIIVEGHMVPLTHEITESFLKKGTVSEYLGKTGYQTMTSRGCPYSCAYCINSTMKEMYGGKRNLRWRSISHVMSELMWVKKYMPYVDYVWISDDEFMARKLTDLEEFSKEYKDKIGLPFSCLVSPLSVTEEKMSFLVDANLIYVQMGVESGSVRMQEMFNRKRMNNKQMMKAIYIINKFKHKMYAPSYDFLVDVPFETDEDRIDSLRFISAIPKPFRLQPFTLILYPGTQMYEKAKEKGYISDEFKEIYNKTYTMHDPNYFNLLMALSRKGRFPSLLLKILIRSPQVDILNSNLLRPFFKHLYVGLKKFYHSMKRLSITS